ncbi:META domain-containing protein [bacterium]|nr:META domain-containing protein [bacterium]
MDAARRTRQAMRAIGWGAALAVALAACATRPPAPATRPVSAHDLLGTEWLAEDVGGAGVAEGSHSTLRFAAATQVDGDTGCNRFSGPLTEDGAGIRIGPLATTRRACAPALMDQERRYLAALARATGWQRENDRLILLDDARQPVVRYSQVEPHLPTRP